LAASDRRPFAPTALLLLLLVFLVVVLVIAAGLFERFPARPNNGGNRIAML
jgi:hypothetical protein